MTHTPHLRLTPAEVKALWELGEYTPKGYLHHLILAHRKPGWPWKINNVSQFCRDWGFPRRTFYRAKAALVSDGLIEEEIIGTIELKAISTNVCVTGDTGVPDLAQGVSDLAQVVSDLAQVVPDGSHSSLETTDGQAIQSPTSLNNSFTTTYTGSADQDGVGGSESVKEDRTTLPDQNAGNPNETENPGKDNFIPPILQVTEKFGVNVDDRQLRQAAEKWPDRVETAIACLEEKQLTVKHPTRYLTRAIEDDWRPEKQLARGDWREWYDEAYKRGLVKASQRQDKTILVLTIDEHWIPFEHLRRQTWEELEAQLKPITVQAEHPIEAIETTVVPLLEG